jgi:hypothetical protein
MLSSSPPLGPCLYNTHIHIDCFNRILLQAITFWREVWWKFYEPNYIIIMSQNVPLISADWTMSVWETDYIALMKDEWYVSMVHWWNDNERGKLKYPEKTLSQCHFVHHKSHTDWPGIVQVPPQWEANDKLCFNTAQPTELWMEEYYLFTFLRFCNTLLIWVPYLWKWILCSTSIPTNDRTFFLWSNLVGICIFC